ncbi:hypothetical protein [Sediminibacillus halophilus]|uniref:Uncharacterized protein n=1 Tax=Sediminibacillus halophilus TaxID=482461 RepID=A0A1G9NQN9_9BACI|nr:hypothetical protein [Sediminibacillus halophilus]SDL88902.1 hypothetical protein SAMN05216244_1118 [Sediminibacillus halophilus]
MKALLSVVFELLRIVFIFVFLSALIWMALGNIYTWSAGVEKYQWLVGIAIYLVLFVLYRNKWQFSGWYQGEGRKRLSKTVTKGLLISALVLFVAPFVLSLTLS